MSGAGLTDGLRRQVRARAAPVYVVGEDTEVRADWRFRLLGRAAASWQRNQHGENEVEFGLTHLFLSRSGFFPIAGFGLRVFAERFDPPSHRMLIPPRNHVKGRTLGLWMSE